MRRVRHLEMNESVILVGQKTSQLMTFSNCSNVLLERTWHRQSIDDYELKIHAKFNGDSMNGLQVMAGVYKGRDLKSSFISAITLYRVALDTWVETFITTNAPSEITPGTFSLNITQATLGLDELSGLETYAVEVVANRKRKKFSQKIWVNHLGCFDSINRLQKEVNYLHSTKLDE